MIVIVEFPAAIVDETVKVAVTELPAFALAGEKLSVTPAGAFAARPTLPLNPFVAAIAIVKVVDLPCCKLTELIDGVMVKLGAAITAKATVAVRVIVPLVPVIVIVELPAANVDETVKVAVTELPAFALAGEKLSVTPAGTFAARPTLPLNPFVPAIAIVKVVDLPCCKLAELSDGVIVKLGTAAGAEVGHSVTSRFASTEPSPVARLNVPPLAVKPFTPGTVLLPDGVE